MATPTAPETLLDVIIGDGDGEVDPRRVQAVLRAHAEAGSALARSILEDRSIGDEAGALLALLQQP
jgi:hypothetical protein